MSYKPRLLLFFVIVLIGIIVINNISGQEITSSNYSGYSNQVITNNFNVYFKANTNVDSAVRFEKDGYFFTYDLSGGQILWKEKPGQPAQSSTLGSGFTSNTKDTQVTISGNKATYTDAFSFTNVTYEVNRNGLKENFVLSNISSGIKDYLYLEYSGNIKFNSSLKICANGICYTPSGTNDNFNTSGQIDFRDASNNTIFYLAKPIAIDSAGNKLNLIYVVHGSNAQMNFYLRIPTSFLQNAVYPIFIDPTIKIEINDAEHLDTNRLFIRNVYDEVSNLDDITATIPQNEYVRIRFEQNLSSEQDITIYARGSESSYVEIYEKDSDYLLGTFNEINETLLDYRQLLTNLNGTQDTFDLKIMGGSVEFDYITDPTYSNYTTGQAIYGVFADAQSTNFLNLTCQLRACALNDCSDASFVTYSNNTFSNLSALPNVSYFQFKSIFFTQNLNYTPYLFNFTIGYTELGGTAPTISIVYPSQDGLWFSNDTIEINYTFSEVSPDTCWWNLNNGANNTITCGTNITGQSWNQGVNNVTIYINNTGGLSASAIRTFNVDTINPNATLVGPGNGTYNSTTSQNFTTNLTDNLGIKNATLYIFNQSGEYNQTTITFVSDTIQTTLGIVVTMIDGVYNWFYKVFDWAGNTYTTDNNTITIDTTSPLFSNNLTSIANGTEYSPGNSYQFNITIENTNGTAGIEFNGINYSLSNISNSFYYNPGNLGVGTYTYSFWSFGNGTSHNFNSSQMYSYTIIKNSSLVLGLTATTPITYPAVTDFTGSGCPSQLTCSLNISNVVYGAGTVSANYSTTGNANYSATSTTFTVTINQNTTYNVSVFGITPLTYPSPAGVSNSSCPSQITCNLYRNNTAGTITSPDNMVLAAGSYNYTFNTTGNTNYSAKSSSFVLTINQDTSSCDIAFNTTSPQTYPAKFRVYSNCTSAFYITRNGTIVSNNSEQDLAAGTYNFTVFRNDSENYTNIVDQADFTINQGTPVITKKLNGGTSNITITYPQQVNATASSTLGTIKIYRDNNDVTSENGLNVTLSAGGYIYKFNVTGNANWTSIAGEYMQVNISKATPVLTFKANSGIANLTLNYPQQINISATSNAGTVGLDKDNVSYLSNGLNITLGVGSYILRANITGNQNYSNIGYSYYNITINQGTSVVYTYINNSRANITIMNGTSMWLNATRQAGEGIIELYKNGTLINSGTGPLSNLTNFTDSGLFNITAVYSATQNYSLGYETWWLNVTNTNITPSLYCGDGTCNNGETCSTCAGDCGSCGGGGSGGSGGGTSGKSFWDFTYSNDYKELKNLPPILQSLEEKQRVSILINSETHFVGVTDITNDKVTINVSSNKSQQVTLTPGESAKFEINNDSYYDLRISLNNIYKSLGTNKANLTITYIHEGIPNGLIDIEMPIIVQNSSNNDTVNIYITNSTNQNKLDICSIGSGKNLGVCAKNILGTMGLFIKNIILFIKNSIGNLVSLLVSYKCSVGPGGNLGICVRNIFGNPFLLFVTFLVIFISWATYTELHKKKKY